MRCQNALTLPKCDYYATGQLTLAVNFKWFSNKLHFLTKVWNEVCSVSSLIQIEVAHFTVADNLCLRLHWAEQTPSLFEESPSISPVFPQIKYADICSVLHELVQFLAGASIAFIVVFLTNINFGHVCVPIKVNTLLSVYRVVISTVAYSMYVCMEHNVFIVLFTFSSAGDK